MEHNKERWKFGMKFVMYISGVFSCIVHLQLVFGQVIGNGMKMDVNNFFPHLLENSMHAINPMAANSARLTGKECLTSGNNIYGHIPMGNPMQTGFIANEQCPCQYLINSLGCYICSCSSDSPKTNINIVTPKVPGLNLQFLGQYHEGLAHTTNRHIDNPDPQTAKTSLSTAKTQTNTNPSTISFPPTGSQNDITTSTTSLSFFNPTTTENEIDASEPIVRSTMIPSAIANGDLYKTNYDKAVNESSFPEEYLAIIVGLVIVLSLFLVLAVIFVLKWRSTTRELIRQQSELYFVEKTNRQSSIVSELTLELEREKRSSVYSVVEDDIESPSPHSDILLTPTVPPLTPGQKQQMAFRYPADDRHDYLELI